MPGPEAARTAGESADPVDDIIIKILPERARLGEAGDTEGLDV